MKVLEENKELNSFNGCSKEGTLLLMGALRKQPQEIFEYEYIGNYR